MTMPPRRRPKPPKKKDPLAWVTDERLWHTVYRGRIW